jgi:hypothetical protein
MVSSIVPGANGAAAAFGAEPRFARSANGAQQREEAGRSDTVELSSAALNSARESVRAGIAHVQEALALGQEAQSMLVKAQGAARAGSQAELDAALKAFADRLEAALSRGASIVAGGAVTIQAEPGGLPVTVEGVDLRLKASPGADDVISVSADARVDDPQLAMDVQRSLEKLQEEMSRLLESVRALEAHQGFLGAAESASQVRSDLNADSARLLALQVRQGLQAAGAPSIANVEPQAVLSLFRA